MRSATADASHYGHGDFEFSPIMMDFGGNRETRSGHLIMNKLAAFTFAILGYAGLVWIRVDCM